ncbi:MAG: ATP-binding protein [Candidatus Omnitrophota bacterium]
MLVEFSAANYLSFMNRTVLSLAASKDDSLAGNVIPSVQGTKLNLLKSAVLIGANSSGKSNWLRAMNYAASRVRYSHLTPEAGETGVVPFLFDENCSSRPSEFEIVFLKNGVRYIYGFAADALQTHEEWLFDYPKGQRRKLFYRRCAVGANESVYEYGNQWKKGKRGAIERLARPNVLFLTAAAQSGQETARCVYDWFDKDFLMAPCDGGSNAEVQYTLQLIHNRPEFKQKLLCFLNAADFNIMDFTIEKQSQGVLNSAKNGTERLACAAVIRRTADRFGNPTPVYFPWPEESEGFRKLFALAGPMMYALANGSVLLADSMDACLHPALIRRLIQSFHGGTNSQGAQLILSVQNDGLLDDELFRRDQVWFMEKHSASGASSLYSLWDFKKTRGGPENIRQGYRMGKYGAVPTVGTLLE